jgi:hypothetical protein
MHLPLLLQARQVPHGLLPVPSAEVLQEGLGADLLRKRDLLHEVGLRTAHQDLLLQSLQDGARATHLLLQGLQDGARATDPHLLLQGLQDGS